MENMNSFENLAPNRENNIEKPSFIRKCTQRLSMGGLALSAGFVAYSKVDDYNKNEKWEAHVEQTFDQNGKESIRQSEERIKEIFGDRADEITDDIKRGDQIAFEEMDEDKVAPEFSNFDEGLGKYVSDRIKEAPDAYPKGWVNGEIGEVVFKNEGETLSFGDRSEIDHETQGTLTRSSIFSKKPYIQIMKTDWTDVGMVSGDVISHELGHGNDWECDSSLNLLERYQLLLDTHKRMESPDAYRRTNGQYHELYQDGSHDGLYTSTLEYWAEICSQYFDDPKGFAEKYPEDYKLVDRVVKKNDPTFDVMKRVKFDTKTGLPLQ